jgi:N-acetylmuramoyl-L-alanine amidase
LRRVSPKLAITIPGLTSPRACRAGKVSVKPRALYGGTTAMATDYTVRQGDYLSKIAKEFGFSDYLTIWNHPDNSELKSKRKNPNVLYPGDKLVIPDRNLREENCPVDKRHIFKKKGPALRLRLILEDAYEEPIANAQCLLAIEGGFRSITTDGQGKIDEPLAPGTTRATIIIQDAQQTHLNNVEIPIKIGHLDPLEELSGQRARLKNLGYFPGKADDKNGPAFVTAVERFQAEHGLTVDGICGPKTQGKLKEVHGC